MAASHRALDLESSVSSDPSQPNTVLNGNNFIYSLYTRYFLFLCSGQFLFFMHPDQAVQAV